MTHGFSARFAGIGFRFSAEFPFDVPQEFQPFLVDTVVANERFTLSAITEPLRFDAPLLCSGTLNAYRTPEGIAREYPYLRAPDGCCAVTLQRPNGENTLYLPQCELSRYRRDFSLSVILGAEAIFLRHDALLLHSSAVCLGGRAVLFCGARCRRLDPPLCGLFRLPTPQALQHLRCRSAATVNCQKAPPAKKRVSITQ